MSRAYSLRCENARDCGHEFRVDASGLAEVRDLVGRGVMTRVLCPACRFIEYAERIARLILSDIPQIPQKTWTSTATQPPPFPPQHPGPTRWV